MRTNVEFDSDAFPAYPGEEETINPGIHGKRLVEYLVPALAERGFVMGEAYAEDWGWEIPVLEQPFRMYIGCASNQMEEGGPSNHFMVFIDPSKPVVSKGWLFARKKISTVESIAKLADALDEILRAHGDVHDLNWENRP